MWAVRIMHERQRHADSCFLTLTYDNEHLPYGECLHYPHFQGFMKRLRSRLDYDFGSECAQKIGFYMCGEYGERLGRPHYHACLFGFGFRFDRTLHKTTDCGEEIFRSDYLSSLWTDGFASVGELSLESAAYVARYCCKKVVGKGAQAHYEKLVFDTGEVIQTVPEFARMSLNPAIGKAWYDKFVTDVFPADRVIMNGRAYRPPRYYSEKFKLSDPVSFDVIKAARLKRAMECVDDCTPERLAVREIVKTAALSVRKRSLSE